LSQPKTKSATPGATAWPGKSPSGPNTQKPLAKTHIHPSFGVRFHAVRITRANRREESLIDVIGLRGLGQAVEAATGVGAPIAQDRSGRWRALEPNVHGGVNQGESRRAGASAAAFSLTAACHRKFHR
jgi:hypothetical protein